MLLFLISVVLISGSAFFIANLLDSKNSVNNTIYFFLSAFSEIILTFEILSLFSKISVSGVLFGNSILFLITFCIWLLRGRPLIKADYSLCLEKFLRVIKLDKTLAVLSAGFLFMILISIFLIALVPSNEASAIGYHVARSLFWIEQGNLNHFNISDARALAFPINSELLYTWVMLFLKNDVFLSGFSLLSFVLYIVSLYGITGKCVSSLRQRLWVVLIISSFTAVIAYLSSTETNIMVAALCTAGLYLVIEYFKKDEFSLLFMSALAFALSIGVKTSAFFVLPAVILWFIATGLKFKISDLFKKFGIWVFLLFLNFLIFSSYNFILNFINYGDFISIPSLMQSHKNLFGLKGFLFNSVNYFLMMFKFSGLDRLYNFSDAIFSGLKSLVKIFNEPFLIGHYTNDNTFSLISADRSGLGLNGIFVFLPCLIISFAGLFSRQGNKKFLINSFSLIFIISFIIMAYSVVYMSFNIRFIVTFALICAPVICYSYKKKLTFYKCIVTIIAFGAFLYVPLNITNQNVFSIINYFRHGYSIEKIRETAVCSSISNYIEDTYKSVYCSLRDYIKSFGKQNRVLYLSQESDGLLIIKKLQFEGYKIDVDLIENLENINLNKYNMIITLNNNQYSQLFRNLNKIYKGVYRGSGVTCVYNKPDGSMVFNPRNEVPYISNCSVSEDFWRRKNFKLKEILTFSENFDNIERAFKYYIYENSAKPLKMRLH